MSDKKAPNRRDFIKTTIATGASLSGMPGLPSSLPVSVKAISPIVVKAMMGSAAAIKEFEEVFLKHRDSLSAHKVGAYVKNHSADLWLKNFEQIVREGLRCAKSLKPRLDIIAQDAQDPDGILSDIIRERTRSLEALKSLQVDAISYCKKMPVPELRRLDAVFEFETEKMVNKSLNKAESLLHGITGFDQYFRTHVQSGVLKTIRYPEKFNELQTQTDDVLQKLSHQYGVDLPSIRILLENSVFDKDGVWDLEMRGAKAHAPENIYDLYYSKHYWELVKSYSRLDDAIIEDLKKRSQDIVEAAMNYNFPERSAGKNQSEAKRQSPVKDINSNPLKRDERTDPLSADMQLHVDGVRNAAPYQDWTGRALKTAQEKER